MVFVSWLAPLAGAGILISIYILYVQKTSGKPACLIGKNCDIVIGSKYAKTLGVENTVLGLAYYSILLAFFLLAPPIPWEIILALSALGALFSVYLTYIQFFVIKGFCDYCMAANMINWAIFILLL